MAEREGSQPAAGGSLGLAQRRSVLGGRQVLRRVVSHPGSLEVSARGTQPSGRLDAVTEGSARDQRGEPDLRDPDRGLSRLEPLTCVAQDLEVRRFGRHAHTMARLGEERKASAPCPDVVFRAPTARHDRQMVAVYQRAVLYQR